MNTPQQPDDPFNGLTQRQAQLLIVCRKDDSEADSLANQHLYAEADALYGRSYEQKKSILSDTSLELLIPLNGLLFCANKLGKPHLGMQWEYAAREILKHHLGDEYDDQLSYAELRDLLVQKQSEEINNQNT